MRFALLDLDSDTITLVQQIACDEQHELVFAMVEESEASRLRTLAPVVELRADWESLLSGQMADAVIVSRGRDEEVRADQLRKLIQADIPLLVSHPVQRSMLVCYELDMIRQESHCPIMPYSRLRFSSGYERFYHLVKDGPESVLGELEQVIFERWLVDRTPDHVREEFARDMDLARPLAGELTRLAAMAPTSEPAGYANLGVQLSGPAGTLVRWSGGAVETNPGLRITVVGSRGRAVLHLLEGTPTWNLNWANDGASGSEEFPPADGAARALDIAARLVQREPVSPDWQDSCRAIELADSIQRSLEKGRTVELHYEDYTEASTFKGTMTSLGCGLLWISSLILIIGVVAAGFRLPLADYWPHFLLVALGVFLLLQLLQFAFPVKNS